MTINNPPSGPTDYAPHVRVFSWSYPEKNKNVGIVCKSPQQKLVVKQFLWAHRKMLIESMI